MAAAGKGKGSKTIVWIIVGLLIIGLAGFGTTNFGGSAQRVASVGDRDITAGDYASAIQQELRALNAQVGGALTLSQALEFGLDQGVMRRLLATAALENEASKLGLSVGDEVVRDQVLQRTSFQGLDGTFDRDAYAQTLRHNGLTEAEFEDDIRFETASTILQASVIGGLAVPSGFTDGLLNFVAETRDITWARLGPDTLFTGLPVPSEDDLSAFHEANAEAYTLPETKSITYAWLTPDMIVDTVEINEDLVRQTYDERSAEFNQPARRLAERLVFASDDAAASAKARLDAGEISFDALVEERGLSLSDVDIGDVSEADLGDAAATVFALTEPGIAGPAPSDLGPALFRVNAILEPQSVPFEDAAPDLRAELALDAARRSISAEINAIDDLLAGGATMEEVADETQMQLGQIDWTRDSDSDIAAYQAFRAAAEQVTSSDFPEVAELDDGGVFALQLDEVIAPRLQPLEDVRTAVTADWERAELTKALVALAEGQVSDIENGVEVAALGLSANTETGLPRDAFIEETPAALIEEAFSLEPGKATVVPGDGAAFILRLDAVHAPDLEDGDTAATASLITQQTRQSLAQDVFEAFTSAIQAEAGIAVDQTMINAVHTQFP